MDQLNIRTTDLTPVNKQSLTTTKTISSLTTAPTTKAQHPSLTQYSTKQIQASLPISRSTRNLTSQSKFSKVQLHEIQTQSDINCLPKQSYNPQTVRAQRKYLKKGQIQAKKSPYGNDSLMKSMKIPRINEMQVQQNKGIRNRKMYSSKVVAKKGQEREARPEIRRNNLMSFGDRQATLNAQSSYQNQQIMPTIQPIKTQRLKLKRMKYGAPATSRARQNKLSGQFNIPKRKQFTPRARSKGKPRRRIGKSHDQRDQPPKLKISGDLRNMLRKPLEIVKSAQESETEDADNIHISRYSCYEQEAMPNMRYGPDELLGDDEVVRRRSQSERHSTPKSSRSSHKGKLRSSQFKTMKNLPRPAMCKVSVVSPKKFKKMKIDGGKFDVLLNNEFSTIQMKNHILEQRWLKYHTKTNSHNKMIIKSRNERVKEEIMENIQSNLQQLISDATAKQGNNKNKNALDKINRQILKLQKLVDEDHKPGTAVQPSGKLMDQGAEDKQDDTFNFFKHVAKIYENNDMFSQTLEQYYKTKPIKVGANANGDGTNDNTSPKMDPSNQRNLPFHLDIFTKTQERESKTESPIKKVRRPRNTVADIFMGIFKKQRKTLRPINYLDVRQQIKRGSQEICLKSHQQLEDKEQETKFRKSILQWGKMGQDALEHKQESFTEYFKKSKKMSIHHETNRPKYIKGKKKKITVYTLEQRDKLDLQKKLKVREEVMQSRPLKKTKTKRGGLRVKPDEFHHFDNIIQNKKGKASIHVEDHGQAMSPVQLPTQKTIESQKTINSGAIQRHSKSVKKLNGDISDQLEAFLTGSEASSVDSEPNYVEPTQIKRVQDDNQKQINIYHQTVHEELRSMKYKQKYREKRKSRKNQQKLLEIGGDPSLRKAPTIFYGEFERGMSVKLSSHKKARKKRKPKIMSQSSMSTLSEHSLVSPPQKPCLKERKVQGLSNLKQTSSGRKIYHQDAYVHSNTEGGSPAPKRPTPILKGLPPIQRSDSDMHLQLHKFDDDLNLGDIQTPTPQLLLKRSTLGVRQMQVASQIGKNNGYTLAKSIIDKKKDCEYIFYNRKHGMKVRFEY